MATRIIGITDRIANSFSKFGRERNHLYKSLNERGINHIRERKLPDGSRVALGYKNKNSKSATYAFRLNPDLTMVQKHYRFKHVLNGLGDQILNINKTWADNKGNAVNKIARELRYRNGEIVGESKHKKLAYNTVNVMELKGESIGREIVQQDLKELSDMAPESISRVYWKQIPGKYLFIQSGDGNRVFKKDVNGVEYSFSTAK